MVFSGEIFLDDPQPRPVRGRHNVRCPFVFRSLGRSVRLGSDIDIVVDFPPGSPHTLVQLAKMEEELERIFGRRIDLLTRQAIEKSRNYIRKKGILASMENVYGA